MRGIHAQVFPIVKERLRMRWGLESSRIAAARRRQHEPWPWTGDVNETAEPYREFPGQFVRCL
jgi:hypothetical protein